MNPTQLPDSTKRELQLELVRVRAEAAAARLEARAAELELMLIARRSDSPRSTAAEPRLPIVQSHSQEAVSGNGNSLLAPAEPQRVSHPEHQQAADALIAAIHRLLANQDSDSPVAIAGSSWADAPPGNGHGAVRNGADQAGDVGPATAPDAGWEVRLRNLQQRRSTASDGPQDEFSAGDHPAATADPAVERAAPTAGEGRQRASSVSRNRAFRIEIGDSARNRTAPPPEDAELRALELTDDAAAKPEQRPLRPAAWLTSTVAHVAVLLLLGLLSLSTQPPRDQLAFSAAVSETSAEVQTFTIEASEAFPETAPSEPTEPTLEVSPMGEIPVTELALELPTVKPAVATEMFNTRAGAMSSLAQVLKGDTAAKVQFAGVEGGGNHFVYLVDSSKSMRNFNEARNELLRSVEALQTHQRFYVVFYDQNPDYMRLSGSQVDEPTSVLATDANKQALRRWAMTIQQQPGKSPTEVLPFAFKLRPDVIFLLSDGEFAAQTEAVIRQHNRRDNLFGEAGPISIIHTIRYPGYSAAEARNAEEQMKRIAAENGGQYRNIVLQ